MAEGKKAIGKERERIIETLKDILKKGDTVYCICLRWDSNTGKGTYKLLVPYVDCIGAKSILDITGMISRLFGYKRGKAGGITLWYVSSIIDTLSGILFPDTVCREWLRCSNW